MRSGAGDRRHRHIMQAPTRRVADDDAAYRRHFDTDAIADFLRFLFFA